MAQSPLLPPLLSEWAGHYRIGHLIHFDSGSGVGIMELVEVRNKATGCMKRESARDKRLSRIKCISRLEPRDASMAASPLGGMCVCIEHDDRTRQ